MITHDFREVFAVPVDDTPENLRWKKRKVLNALRTVYDMDAAFISWFHGTSRMFDEVDLSPEQPNLRLARGMSGPLHKSYCYRISENMAPNLMTDARHQPGVADIPETHSWPIGAHVSVPIILSSGVTFGMLCAFSCRPDPTLSQRDLSMFALCADLLARDIETSTLAVTSMAATADLLQDAIANSQFLLHLQPIMDLPGRRLTGYELLTRFPPDIGRTEEIFHSARALDLLSTLEEVIARHAQRVLDRLPRHLSLSINFSVASVEALDFEDMFSPADRARIIIEITEHENVANYATFAAAVQRLRGLGLRIAIDDVGAGYASFRHVIQLSPDIIKIDRSLISGIDRSAERVSLLSALRDYCALHGARIIAEGVETAEELARLETLGIPYAQGFALGRPAPWRDLLD